jgi:hypothetical protein
MAYIQAKDGYPFAIFKDIFFSRALEKTNQGEDAVKVNYYESEQIHYTCLPCCEALHRTTYTNEKGTPNNDWIKNAKLSKGLHKKTSIQFALKISEKIRPELAVKAVDVHKAMQDDMFKRAMDWIVELAGFMWLMYGCIDCRSWPVKSCFWLRSTRTVVASDYKGMSDFGESVGHWRCCGCGDKWTWATGGAYRLLVIGWSDVANGFEQGYRFCFVGQSSAVRRPSAP